MAEIGATVFFLALFIPGVYVVCACAVWGVRAVKLAITEAKELAAAERAERLASESWPSDDDNG